MREAIHCRTMVFLGFLWAGVSGFAEVAETVIVCELIDVEADVGISGEVSLASNDERNLFTRHEKSDEVGHVEFQHVEAGRWQLTTKIEGYASEHAIIDVVEGETHQVTLYLKKGGRITGRISDSEGKPIAQARVNVRYARDTGASHVLAIYQWESGNVVTDLEGMYEIRDVHPRKRFVVEVSHEDFLPSISVPMTRRPVDNAPVNLSLNEGLPVAGTVQAADGVPIAGARVGLLGSLPQEASKFLAFDLLEENRRFTLSNGEGLFQFDQVRPGTKLILVSHPSYRKSQQFLDLPKSGQRSSALVTLFP